MKDRLDELIQSAKAGNHTAFAELAAQYSPLLESMTEKFGRASGIEAEDLKQEAVIALYNAVCSYDPSCVGENEFITFGLYAKICVRNRLISEIRKSKRLQTLPEHDYLEVKALLETDPESEAINRESYTALWKLIDETLTSYEKSVFKLYILDKSYHEIAVSLGKTEKSVDNALCRIKTKLKKLI